MASDAVHGSTPRRPLASQSSRPRVASVTSVAAIASLITPLNTSMVPVALEDVRTSLGVGTSTAISLLSAFAFASAIAQPVGGLVAVLGVPGPISVAVNVRRLAHDRDAQGSDRGRSTQ